MPIWGWILAAAAGSLGALCCGLGSARRTDKLRAKLANALLEKAEAERLMREERAVKELIFEAIRQMNEAHAAKITDLEEVTPAET